MLHSGHLEMIEFAKAQGDYLIVSIASDETLEALKRKPVIREHDRYLMVRALKCVDECFIARGIHGNDDCFRYIQNYRPNIWVVDEYDKNVYNKEALAGTYNVKIIKNHRPECGYSTTGIIKEIISNYQS